MADGPLPNTVSLTIRVAVTITGHGPQQLAGELIAVLEQLSWRLSSRLYWSWSIKLESPTAHKGAVTTKATIVSTTSLGWMIGEAAGSRVNTPRA